VRIALAMIAVASAGCSSLLGIDDLHLVDAKGPPDLPDGPPGVDCVGGGLLRVCPTPPPTSQLVIVDLQQLQLDTGSDPSCVVMMSGATEVCVLVHASIEIAGTLRAFGPRPLVLASMSSISIRGRIDVASYLGKPPGAGSEAKSCLAAAIPTDSAGGNGGSFGGAGGAGGNGGQPGPPRMPLTEIRGGCAGGRGGNAGLQQLPGAGGGAVYLIAKDRITLDGTINASGAGGDASRNCGFNGCGGAGGGAGGLIGLDAPTIDGAGTLFANGGGGAGGGGQLILGNPGGESPEAKSAALGGDGSGPGGGGSLGSQLDGAPGKDGQGGGGGGGAAGEIYVRGTFAVSGAISPPPMM
jgi:hypothetical protein